MNSKEQQPMEVQHHNHVVIAVFETCVRCGGEHENLDFERLEPPLEVGGSQFTHWALCPTNQTPILLRVFTESA